MLLDINFNFGDFYGVDSSWLLPVCIAVGTVILTSVAQRFYDNYKSNERLDELFEYMARESQKFACSCVKQAEALQLLGQRLKGKAYTDFKLSKKSDFSVTQISEWSSADFGASIIKRRDERIGVLIALHSNLKSAFNKACDIETLIVGGLKDLNDRVGRIQRDWKDQVHNISYYQDQFARNNIRNKILKDDFLQGYIDITNKWKAAGGDTQIHAVYELVVLPLIDLSKQYVIDDDRAFFVLHDMLRLKSAYIDFDHAKKQYSLWYSDLAHKLTELSITISEVFARIREIKRKSRWHF